MFAWDPSSLLKCSGSSYVAYTCHTILEVRSLLNVMFPYILVGNSWCSSNTLVVWSHDLVVVDPNRRFCTRGRSREDDSVLLFTASPLLVLVLWVWTYFFPSPLAIFLFYPFTLHGIWKQPGKIERRMRGQYAQGLQGRDNSIEVFQQQGPVFVLLAIITSFFPSSISYMTSGVHGIF